MAKSIERKHPFREKAIKDSSEHPTKMVEAKSADAFIALVLDLHTTLLLGDLNENKLLTLSDGKAVVQCDLSNLSRERKSQIKATLDFGWDLWNQHTNDVTRTKSVIAHGLIISAWIKHILLISNGETP